MDETRSTDNKEVTCIFLGSDKRQIYAAEAMADMGFDVIRLPKIEDIGSLQAESREIDLIFPIPLTKKAFIESCNAEPKAFFDLIENKNIKLVGAKIDPEIATLAGEHNIVSVDFGESEPFLLENAYLTAEATVNIIMQRSSRSIRSMNIALFGYGRISKFLLAILRAFGAKVGVFARREESRTLAKCDGAFEAGSLERKEILRSLEAYDVVVNTVEHTLLDAELLSVSRARPILIDLASLPGGIDIETAACLDYEAARELGLPARYAPRDAGAVVAKNLSSLLF